MTPETRRIIAAMSPAELNMFERLGGEVPVGRRGELARWRSRREVCTDQPSAGKLAEQKRLAVMRILREAAA